MKKLLLLIATASAFLSTHADNIPMAYYASLDGKSGAELKKSIFTLVSQNVNMLSYGSGSNSTWWGFYATDYLMDGDKRQVIDRYSNAVFYYGDRGSSVSGMNIEHSFPKSWWGGSTNNAYKDLYNLMPCEAKINNSKSNYAMGVVTNATTDNGCTKVGTGVMGTTKLWEPGDKWKGDFARGYMYMATAYQDLTWSGDALTSLENNAWPTLQKWAYQLYMKWAKDDPITEEESTRNNIISTIQGNRNPFVDFPNLPDYVWGDSIATPFPLKTTVKNSYGGDVADVVYNVSFLDNAADCQTTGTAKVWTITAQYGWKASGFLSGACAATNATLTTPEIDLTDYTSAQMSFMHAANKFETVKPEEHCSVEISVDGGAPTAVKGIKWPLGTNWTFISSDDVDITPFVGHKIKIMFHYTSTTAAAGTWEIKSLKVLATRKQGSIEDIIIDDSHDENAVIEYFSLDGRRLNPDTARGLVIRRQGNTVSKTILR